jgi:hypothetical protein
VQEIGPGKVEVAAIDPIASMQAVQNPRLRSIAEEVKAKLEKVISNV